MKKIIALAAGLLALAVQPAQSAVFSLDFEGIADFPDRIQNFYNGGTDSAGNSGTNYGVAFGSSPYAYGESPGFLVNLPSSSQALFDEAGSYVNVAAGFTTGFSFFYSTSITGGAVTIYDGVDGTGNLLATIALVPNWHDDGCAADPGDNIYCHWDPVGATFAGTARSIQLATNHNFYDNLTFGSATPEGATDTIPEPATWSLVLLTMGGIRMTRRKRTA
jgi:hypothetical protein